jgi:tetratricopeptide (TPR) repeat protein
VEHTVGGQTVLLGLVWGGFRALVGRVTRERVLPAEEVLVRNPQASISLHDGEPILSLPHQREGLALNLVAARCWELFDGVTSLDSIAATIGREYQVAPAAALEEVIRFTSRLRRGYYALSAAQWELAHTHFSDLFAGAREEGVTEIRRGEGMIVHVATAALGPDAAVNPRCPRARWLPLPSRRRAARAAFARHVEREAPLRRAMESFDEGWAHSAAARLPQAAGAFEEACRLAPGWANPHYQLGYVHLRSRCYGSAVSEFERTERLSPGYYMVREYLDLARKLADGHLTFEAFHLFERAASVESADPDAVIDLCRRALELAPDFPSARLVLGRAYARKREYERALQELRGAIDTNPDRSTLCNALYARASIFMVRGMSEQAVRELEKVIELNGSPVATRSAMAHLASSASVH